MKGLIIKDICILKNSTLYFIIYFIIGLSFSLEGQMTMGFFFIAFLTAIFTTSSISYDNYDNSMCFLLTLPISRKDYVKEKYSLIIAATLLAFIVFYIINAIYLFLQSDVVSALDKLNVVYVIPPTIITYLSFVIPFRLKYDGDKAMIVFIIFTVGILLLIGKILGVLSNMSVALFDLDQVIVVPIFYIVSLIFYFVSTKVSTKIMLHKEY